MAESSHGPSHGQVVVIVESSWPYRQDGTSTAGHSACTHAIKAKTRHEYNRTHETLCERWSPSAV
jgi:hypothetical protein